MHLEADNEINTRDLGWWAIFTMQKWAAILLIVFALFHLAMTYILFPDALGRIVGAGLFGGSEWAFDDPEALAAFWFSAYSWPTLALGIGILRTLRGATKFEGARSAGFVLAASVIFCGVLLPISGLWAFLIPALMLMASSSRKQDRNAENMGETALD
ncbi:MAG: DUF6463 family protein [Erythrobacter sp.]